MKNIILSKYSNFIKRKDDVILFHSQIGDACTIDYNIYEVLCKFEKPIDIENIEEGFSFNIPNEELKEIIGEFKKRKILVNEDEDTNYIKEYTNERLNSLKTGKQIKTIQLIVSNNCNFKCKYCFENSIYCSKEREFYQNDKENKIMDKKDAIKYIQLVIDVLLKNKNDSLHIQFFGGEPLTNKPAIKGVIDYFSDGKKFGIDISYSIVTNGSLIDEDIANCFKENQVAVIVSFDNPKKTDRDMISGKDSIQTTFTSLEILKRTQNYVAFNSVLSDYTFDYFNTDIIDCAKEFNVKEVGIVLDLDPIFYEKRKIDDIVDKIMMIRKYGMEKQIAVCGYWMSTYLNIFEHLNLEKGFKTCSGTGSQFSIEPTGAVFACKGSSGYFGNINNINEIFNNKNYKFYSKRSLNNSKQCENCNIQGFCSGFCLGPLEKNYNDINHIENKYCTFMNTMIRKLFMEEDDIDKYEL